MDAALDLQAYLQRIGYVGAPAADLATLAELHLKHPIAIPFENLATLLGAGVSLDLAAIQEKLVGSRRGGYCFEQNRLFAAVLEHIGFELEAHAARVLWGSADESGGGRTHMVLRVRVDSQDYICDVGFGGLTLTAPLLLDVDREQASPHERFRFRAVGPEYLLEVKLDDSWRAMYRFDLQPQRPIDFEVLNHYVATHPDSHFLTTLMAARRTLDGLHTLHNGSQRFYRSGQVAEQRNIGSVTQLRRVLTETFWIDVPEGSRIDGALERALRESDLKG